MRSVVLLVTLAAILASAPAFAQSPTPTTTTPPTASTPPTMTTPAPGPSSGIAISSVSPTTFGYGAVVDIYGSGLSNAQYASLSNGSGCCDQSYFGLSVTGDDHASFNSSNGYLPAGWYVVSVYDGQNGSASYCCVQYAPVDDDADGYAAQIDCDDNDPAIHPYANDIPYDGIDQDCTGADARMPDMSASFSTYFEGNHDDATLVIDHGATNGFDEGMDVPEPPAPPTESYVSSYFTSAANDSRLSVSAVPDAASVVFHLRTEWHGACDCWHWGNIYWNSWQFQALYPSFHAYLIDGANTYDLQNGYCCGGVGFEAYGASGTRDVTILLSTDVLYNLYLPYGWSTVSLPVTPHSSAVADVFGDRIDAIYAWDGGQYVVPATIEPGVGYFVHSSAGNVAILGTPLYHVDVTLQPGWNLVGASYYGGDLLQAPSQVSRTVFSYQYGGYYSTQYMWSGTGFWVYSHEEGATIHLGFQGSLAPPQLPVTTTQSGAATEFQLPFGLASGDLKDAVEVDALDGATDGYDGAFDVMEPPTAASDAWVRGFVATTPGVSMDKSVIAPSARMTQLLKVERNGAAGDVTLSWETSSIPHGYVAQLVDGLTRVDMTHASSYQWSAPAGLSTKALSVVLRPANAPVCLAQLDGDCLAELPFDPLSGSLP